jgi:hypothetical protein
LAASVKLSVVPPPFQVNWALAGRVSPTTTSAAATQQEGGVPEK